MQLFYCDHFVLPLSDGHRFPMDKYRRLRERCELDGRFTLTEPPAATNEQLALAHEHAYIERVISGTMDPREVRALGFPWSPGLVERSRRSNGATITAARAALSEGAAANLAGGYARAIDDIVAIHFASIDCLARRLDGDASARGWPTI